jgi:hypothetical protein
MTRHDPLYHAAPMFQPNGWPIDNIPAGELRGMAAMRDLLGDEASAAGDYRGAEAHWRQAETYRDALRQTPR